MSSPTAARPAENAPRPGRRRRRAVALGLAGALVLGAAACGDDEPGAAATEDEGEADTGAGGSDAGDAAAFPVTIENAAGEVTVEQEPQVVVSAGRTDHDVLLALGIQPAAVYQFLPSMERGVGAWAEDELEGTPALLTDPINLEQVASLQPDLITDVMTIGDDAQYEDLSAIAPTVGLPPGTPPNAVPWQDVTTRIATAVGRAEDGERLVADTEAFLAEAAEAHRELAGNTVTVLLDSGDEIGAYTVADTRMQLLTALGLEPSPFAEDLGEDDYYVPVSDERLGDIESDVVVVLDRTGASSLDDVLARHPTLDASGAAEAGRLFLVEDMDVTLALAGASVLSIPFATDGLLPDLRRAVG